MTTPTTTPTTTSVTTWWRRAVVVASVLGVAALAFGPARYLLTQDRTVGPSTVSLLDDPYAAPRLASWPTGVADTQGSGAITRRAPVGRMLSTADALARAPRTAYVVVTGPAGGRPLPGVGAALTGRDVREVLGLDEPARTDTIRYLTGTRGAALGLFSMVGEPRGRAQLVTSRSGETRRKLLATGEPDVKDLIDVSAQQRPDLSVLVTAAGQDRPAVRPDVGLAASADVEVSPTDPATAAYREAVAAAVDRELLPGLAQRGEVVAPSLLTEHATDGLLALGADGPTPTARGAAYRVAALAVPPGSTMAPVRTTDTIRAAAFERPRGGASVLVWNPGAARRVTIDLPYGDQVHRVRVLAAAGALTAVLLSR